MSENWDLFITGVILVAFLCVVTHCIHTGTPFLALVVAASTVQLVGHGVHTLTIAADLRKPAWLPTFPAVENVCRHIHTPLHAAVWPPAAHGAANLRIFVTCPNVPVEVHVPVVVHVAVIVQSKDVAARPLERSWFLGFHH